MIKVFDKGIGLYVAFERLLVGCFEVLKQKQNSINTERLWHKDYSIDYIEKLFGQQKSLLVRQYLPLHTPLGF